MATPLDVVYASGGEATVVAMELQCAVWDEPIRLVDEWEDLVLGLEDGTPALFEGVGVDYTMPQANASGHQTRTFAIDNVRGAAQQLLNQAIEQGERVTLTLRGYVGEDLTAPASRPLRYSVLSGSMAMATVQLEAWFFDMLGRRWPIHFYTADKFPGLKYQ